MPSAALQSRIAAFESIAASPSQPRLQPSTPLDIHSPPDTARPSFHASPSPSPPNLGRRTSLIDIKDWLDDSEASSFQSNGFSGPSSPPNGQNGQYAIRPAQHDPDTPLIHLESPPRTRAKGPASTGFKAPPLPPRKPSLNSITSTLSSTSLLSNDGREPPQLPARRTDSLTVESAHTYPPKNDQTPRSGHAPASSISSFHSVSLSSDNESIGPSSVEPHIATFPIEREQAQKPNITGESDSFSLCESYEDVSADIVTSPSSEKRILHDWERAQGRSLPPKLPQRPPSTSVGGFRTAPTNTGFSSPNRPPSTTSLQSLARTPSTSSTSSSATALNAPAPYIRRRPPPPPSVRSSDRSSIQSFSSGTSGSRSSTNSLSTISGSSFNFQKTKRPTPVPLAAKSRYEVLFNENIIQRRRAEKQKAQEKPALLTPSAAKKIRQNAGWRGLSVDLIPGEEGVPNSQEKQEDVPIDLNVEPTERLEGPLVKKIWQSSQLSKNKLRDIWHECDPDLKGSLDRDGFVKGMWRIDEELRRAQLQATKSASTTSLNSLRPKGLSRPPPLPNQRSKPAYR